MPLFYLSYSSRVLLSTIALLSSHIDGLSLHRYSGRTSSKNVAELKSLIDRRQSFTTTASSLATLTALSTPTPSHATLLTNSNDELKQIYDSGASTYEALYSESFISRKLDFDSFRQQLLSNARGDVLELGVGTGLNLPHYPKNNNLITSYTAIDLSPKMLDQAKLRFIDGTNNEEAEGRAVSPSLRNLYTQNKLLFQVADVGQLSSIFKTKQFDTIIDTFGLCVFPNPQLVLSQAWDLLSPNGQLLMLEHQDSTVAKVLSPTRNLSDVSKTCRYNDDVKRLVREAGFQNNIIFDDLAGGFLVKVVATKKTQI